MLKNLKLGFVGFGKMAEAMISGLLNKKLVKPSQVIATGPHQARADELKDKYGTLTSTDNLSVIEADIITLSVKPQTMSKVLQELKGEVSAKSLVVSIAAGVRLETLKKSFVSNKLFRAMPNTPGRINQGITVWTGNGSVNKKHNGQISGLLGALGTEIYVDNEKYLDIATALSGTGPAFVYLFMEAQIDAAVREGMPRYLAERLVLGTVSGSVAYAKAVKGHLVTLRNDVTSPAGTSAEALYELELAGFRTAIAKAIRAAHQRCIELGS